MLFFLLAGHALMDYALQTDPMAVCKCRRTDHPLQKTVPWFYWLTAHAFLHGAAVGLIVIGFTGNRELGVALATAETVVHWLIDFGKCEKLYGIHVDQGLHIACKIAWWGLIAGQVV
jgi:hypothetical protein